MGLWHDIRSYPENFQTGTCQNANYELVDGVVDVLNTQVINQTLDTMTGIAVIASNDGSARLNVTFNVGGINGKHIIVQWKHYKCLDNKPPFYWVAMIPSPSRGRKIIVFCNLTMY